MNVIDNVPNQECGRWLNNRAENSHQPFRRRKGAMAKFSDVKTRQKFASIHASIHNHFNLERHSQRICQGSARLDLHGMRLAVYVKSDGNFVGHCLRVFLQAIITSIGRRESVREAAAV